MSDPVQEPIAPDVGDVASAPTAAAESAPNSPLTSGATAEPAESSAPVVDAPAAEATAPTEPPAPVLAEPPTPQPPLPGGIFFDEFGGAHERNPITEPRRTYVDPMGKRISVRVLAERGDGSVDVALPATVGEYRRDGVRRRSDPDQKGDFIE